MPSRKNRRRAARARAKGPQRQPRSIISRLASVALGALMTIAGIGLVVVSSGSDRSLRVAGILTVVGIIVALTALIE